uniref:peptidylprolyl isomerase n=2 Tax=Gouania willdenowi TaxID=441366 RepID=A0A8C5GQI6_GOUWI
MIPLLLEGKLKMGDVDELRRGVQRQLFAISRYVEENSPTDYILRLVEDVMESLGEISALTNADMDEAVWCNLEEVVYQSSDSASVMKSGNNIVVNQSMRRETDPQPPADGWLDIFGNGSLMKKVLQAGRGRYSMPQPGQIVKIHLITRLLDGTLINKVSELSLTLGDGEVIYAVDVAVQLMEMREKALFQVRSAVELKITLLEATDAPDLKLLPPTEKIDLATCKREQGNVLDQHRDLKPRNKTIRDEVSTMMKKHSEDDEKMLENPSSTHKHQAKSAGGLSWK